MIAIENEFAENWMIDFSVRPMGIQRPISEEEIQLIDESLANIFLEEGISIGGGPVRGDRFNTYLIRFSYGVEAEGDILLPISYDRINDLLKQFLEWGQKAGFLIDYSIDDTPSLELFPED